MDDRVGNDRAALFVRFQRMRPSRLVRRQESALRPFGKQQSEVDREPPRLFVLQGGHVGNVPEIVFKRIRCATRALVLTSSALIMAAPIE